ncbi:MAG TPA: tRNA glutamyl-Q(34) synthetase GluQRS [Methylophilaceae bacterium]|jgi:glutamyl-Q tRNA(Asp) synthetase
MTYIGRFAPSPTGPLHFGSLIAAVASYLEACKHHGVWLIRMDDLDTPRIQPSAANMILKTIENFGFEWHGDVLYQSERTDAYISAFQALSEAHLIYPCSCSRKEIADSASHGIDGLVYPNTCRLGVTHERKSYAWRIKTEDACIKLIDLVQGSISQNLSTDIGDFVLKRADGLFTYQLATVVDDWYQGVTHIVRGSDLLSSTPRQIYLQQKLQLPQPNYAHIPVATNAKGEKLSKQTLATSLVVEEKARLLHQALAFLGQNPPPPLQYEHISHIWQWAKSNWKIDNVPKQTAIQITKFTS